MESDNIFGFLGTMMTAALGIIGVVSSFKKKREKAKGVGCSDQEQWDERTNSHEAYVEIVRKREAAPAVKLAPLDIPALKKEPDAPSAQPESRKEKFDARKMIIYSEIIKPKFDEGLK